MMYCHCQALLTLSIGRLHIMCTTIGICMGRVHNKNLKTMLEACCELLTNHTTNREAVLALAVGSVNEPTVKAQGHTVLHTQARIRQT